MARLKGFDEEQTLEKAMTLFWNKGYTATTAQDIVDTLGLSRSSIYDTYGDKHSLFVKALKRYRQKKTAYIVDYLDNADHSLKAIKHIFKLTAKECVDQGLSNGCFMVNTRVELAPHDISIATIVNENRQALEDAFYRVVKRGQEKEQLSSKRKARPLARYLLNSLWGLSVYAKSGTDPEVFEDVIKTTLSVL